MYYTTELKGKSGGAVTLHDGGTGSQVTIQNSEVQSVSKEKYETGREAHQAVVSPPRPSLQCRPPAGEAAQTAAREFCRQPAQQLVESKEQVDRTISSLKELAEPGQADLKGAYKAYSAPTSISSTSRRHVRRADADAMRKARAAYFAMAGEDRRDGQPDAPPGRRGPPGALPRGRGADRLRRRGPQGELRPVHDGPRRRVQAFLTADGLSADRTSILGPLTQKSEASGAMVKEKIDAFVAELDAVEGEASGPAPAKSGQPAGGQPNP